MKNKILEATCVDMTIEGYGVCKVDGLVIFTKGLIIGEKAMIKIISHKKNLAYAIIDKLLVKSPYRIEEDCKVAYKCGGCNLKHVDYSYQLELKKKWLKETLFNIGNIDIEVPDIVASPLINNYRNKVQVPVNNHKVGFYRSNSHDIIECDRCYIQSNRANEVVNFIKDIILKEGYDQYFRHILIKEGFTSKEMMIGLILNVETFNGLNTLVSDLVSKFNYITSVIVNINNRDDNVILGDKEIVMYGSSYIIDYLDNLEFKISLKSFYQINALQTVNLYNEIVNKAHITKDTKILDLYSGIGTIALFLARYAKDVIGVEVVEDAVINAKDNALANKIENVAFFYDDASNDMNKYIKNRDLVVVDPPRKGLNRKLIEDLVNNNIKQIAYVSCNPATLARDLAIFKDLGYTTKSLRGFDMFPHTIHIESVALLQKHK